MKKTAWTILLLAALSLTASGCVTPLWYVEDSPEPLREAALADAENAR